MGIKAYPFYLFMGKHDQPLSVMLLKSMQIAIDEITNELKQQGHNNTGALIRSIKPHIKIISDGLRGEITMLDRYVFIQNRTPGARIPFAGRRKGRGKGKSKYIQGLISFFKSKGAQNPISAAFATAYTQKKEGRPSKGSFLFTKNGRRTGFLNYSLKNIEQRIYERLSIDISKYINLQING
jgi:hypothetical protein